MLEKESTDCTECVYDGVSSASLRTEVTKSRTMFRIKHLEGGKFKLEREGGSPLESERKYPDKHSIEKSSVRNICDKFEHTIFQENTHHKITKEIIHTDEKVKGGC